MGGRVIYLLPYRHWQGRLPPSDISLESFLIERFHQPGCIVTPTGRAALALVLQELGLQRQDEVYIATTFDYPNVSSCVTCTVFNFCKPARVLSDRTRAILVIHEFGVPHPNLVALRGLADARAIPLIEDCAHTLDSWVGNTLVGTVGDYVICSFPKVFPVPFGGALLGSGPAYLPSTMSRKRIAAVYDSVTPHLPFLGDYSECRRSVFRELTSRFGELGLSPVFEVSNGISPWFFPVPMPKWEECLELAPTMGVECSLWHGSQVVVFPCHQFLEERDIERICELAAAVRTYEA